MSSILIKDSLSLQLLNGRRHASGRAISGTFSSPWLLFSLRCVFTPGLALSKCADFSPVAVIYIYLAGGPDGLIYWMTSMPGQLTRT